MSSPNSPVAGQQSGFVQAGWLRRILALCVDWAASSLVAAFLVGGFDDPAYGWMPLLVALAGGSFGQLLARIRVHRLDGRPLSLLRALQRQLLVCLVIPPLVFRPDGRGLHDLWTGSGAFRMP